MSEVKKKIGKRVKKQPTKDEKLKLLKQEMDELTEHTQALKSEQGRFAPASFPKIAELIQDELDDLAEDFKEMEMGYNELSSQPEVI